MKPLNQYIQEKLIINKDYIDVKTYHPQSFDELRKIVEDRYKKLGAGTEQKPIDFNDIDVSDIDSFCSKYDIGIFESINFKYIDISYWNVSNVKSMRFMFSSCKKLKSVGNLLKWNVSNVTNMSYMFYVCKSFNQDISKWNVSKVTDMTSMFDECNFFNQDLSKWNVSSVTNMENMFWNCKNFNQDISKWDVSSVKDMTYMFSYCENFNQDLSKWNVSNVKFNGGIFKDCPIKEEYKPKFK